MNSYLNKNIIQLAAKLIHDWIKNQKYCKLFHEEEGDSHFITLGECQEKYSPSLKDEGNIFLDIPQG